MEALESVRAARGVGVRHRRGLWGGGAEVPGDAAANCGSTDRTCLGFGRIPETASGILEGAAERNARPRNASSG